VLVVWALLAIVAAAILVPLIAMRLSRAADTAPLPREPFTLRLKGLFRRRPRRFH